MMSGFVNLKQTFTFSVIFVEVNMDIVVFDGKIEKTELSDLVESELRARLKEHNVDWVNLSQKHIKPCMGCFGCWVKTPGLCVANDDANDMVRKMVNCDLVVELSPVTFGGYSSELKKVLDRSIPILLPYFKRIKGEIHHYQRYENVPRHLMIGYRETSDPLSADCYLNLTHRNALNMQPPKWSSVVIDGQAKVPHALEKSLKEVL